MLRSLFLLAALITASCGPDSGPPLAVSKLEMFAPLPGSSAGVAYMIIENHSSAPIRLQRVRSPQFGSVEMHESLMENGVMKMRPIDDLVVGAGDSVIFESGGRHFMLIGAKPDVAAGTAVTLELVHEGGLLQIVGDLQSRLPAQ
jgi:copper(I)-binding protein